MSTRLPYQPELDGLRALAVTAVVLFHGEVPGFRGGFLGVSLFFTISGYLITALLLEERSERGRIDVAGFYARRARRLLPASLVCLAGITAAAATTNWFSGVTTLQRDLIGALAQVSNWVFLFGDGSYQALFAEVTGRVSPLEHYWSLAIEEQFYWVWPLAVIGLTSRVRSPRGRLSVVAGVTLATAASAPVIAVVWGGDAAYWATPPRASEILVGAVVALIVHDPVASATPWSGWRWCAAPALVALGLGVVFVPSAGGPAFAGALPLVGAVSAVLLMALRAGATGSPGVVDRVLRAGPLVRLGRISYGIYLFHWPVFVVFDEQRTGRGGPSLLALRLVVTFAIAVASFLLVEQPVRTRPTRRPRGVAVLAASGSAALALVVILLIPATATPYWRSPAVADAARTAEIAPVGPDTLVPLVATSTAVPAASEEPEPSSSTDTSATLAAPTTPSTAPLPVLPRPVRIVVAGDSTAEATGTGLAIWAAERPDLAQVSVLAAAGCGFLRGGELFLTEWRPVDPACESWNTTGLVDEIAALRPDVVMLHTTSWDVLDRRWDGGARLNPLDTAYAARLATDFGSITDRILAAGASKVVWVREPVPDPYWMTGTQAQEEPGRHEVLNGVMRDLAAAAPTTVSVIDLPEWLRAEGLLTDRDARPDGVHWSPDAAARIAREFLGEALVRRATGIG